MFQCTTWRHIKGHEVSPNSLWTSVIDGVRSGFGLVYRVSEYVLYGPTNRFSGYTIGGQPHPNIYNCLLSRYRHSQLSRGLRRRSAAARLMRLWWVRIPLGAWISVCCNCCVLSGRGFCDELITRPEKSYRLWCVIVCDLDTSWMRRPWPTGGCRAKNKQLSRYQQDDVRRIQDLIYFKLILTYLRSLINIIEQFHVY